MIKELFNFSEMTPAHIAGQIAGFIGIIGSIVIYQQKTTKGLLISKLISDFIWGLSYFLLGNIGGGAICVIAIFRETVFMNRAKHKWADRKIWLFVFIGLALSSIIYSFDSDGIWCVATALASAVSVYGFWTGSPKLSRFLRFPISALMLTYDIVFGAFAAILNEAFSIVSAIVGVFRYDIGKNKLKERAKENENS